MNEQEEHVRADEFLGEYKEQPYNRNQVHAGSRVIMTSRYPVPDSIRGLIWTVLTEPKYINGARRVHLKDYNKGPYPVDGLRVVG